MPLDPRGRIVPRAIPTGDYDPNSTFVVRAGDRSDISGMADNLMEGFASYRTWTKGEWELPARTEMLLGMMQRFTRDGSWCFVGFRDHVPAGHVMARPERDVDETLVPGVSRITHLFVRRDHWGSGLADTLHDAMLDSMRERGYTSSVLWTPVGAARARAFYTRKGWQETGQLEPESDLGLELLEYRLEIPPA
jgi:GNAT superfamily N-acetyltransferase